MKLPSKCTMGFRSFVRTESEGKQSKNSKNIRIASKIM